MLLLTCLAQVAPELAVKRRVPVPAATRHAPTLGHMIPATYCVVPLRSCTQVLPSVVVSMAPVMANPYMAAPFLVYDLTPSVQAMHLRKR